MAIGQLHVALAVTDLGQAVRFYQDGLGLDVVSCGQVPVGVTSSWQQMRDIGSDRRGASTIVDQVEVEHRVSGAVPLALKLTNVEGAMVVERDVGAQVLHKAVKTQ